jgi:regulator of protease activity HflC (stomatin/prohibitin superfamily)
MGKGVVLRLGKFQNLRGPGLFWIIPIIDTTPTWIDHRVMVTPFAAQKTLTKDTVPGGCGRRPVLGGVGCGKSRARSRELPRRRGLGAQTALRDIIGRMMLADILVGRSMIDQELQQIIDERTTPWGVSVQSVEIRDIVIPQDLEDAMSRQAQAERERQARVILGESEKQIAASFAEASQPISTIPRPCTCAP